MKNFFIVTRSDDNRNIRIVKDIQSIIQKKGACASYGIFKKDRSSVSTNSDDAYLPVGKDPETLKAISDAEAVISVGGDGTLVFASKLAMRQEIPIIGVNRGHLGYLCDLDESTVGEAIDRLLADDYSTEERMMLRGGITMEGQEFVIESALNDIVVSAARDINLISLSVYINGSYLYSIDADGIVFSTPTGSTAYNLSCGGPIVDPKNKVILLTPINPHSMNSRPLVLDQNDEISVELNRRHSDEAEYALITFDGDKRVEMGDGDRLSVRRSKHTTQMIGLSEMNFLQRMSTKFRESEH